MHNAAADLVVGAPFSTILSLLIAVIAFIAPGQLAIAVGIAHPAADAGVIAVVGCGDASPVSDGSLEAGPCADGVGLDVVVSGSGIRLLVRAFLGGRSGNHIVVLHCIDGRPMKFFQTFVASDQVGLPARNLDGLAGAIAARGQTLVALGLRRRGKTNGRYRSETGKCS